MKPLSPLAQSVSIKASKMNSAVFTMLMLSKDFMFPKSERHVATGTRDLDTNPRKPRTKSLCEFEIIQ